MTETAIDGEKTPATLPEVIGGPTEKEKQALQTKLHIEQLALKAQVTFLKMGQLLYDARENADWSILKYESFKEYVEDMDLPTTSSYSWVSRLIGIYQYLVVGMGLSQKELSLIGVAKLSRLLPLAKEGKLTTEIIEKAKELSDIDLREELGHSVGDSRDTDTSVICPRCGYEIRGAKWVNKKDDEGAQPLDG